jgi:hypothetical protein
LRSPSPKLPGNNSTTALTKIFALSAYQHPAALPGAQLGNLRVVHRTIVSAGLGFAAVAATTAAAANAPVALNSAVFVEHLSGDNSRSLEPASRLTRGDRVVTILSWHRLGGSSGGANRGFTLVNPLPRAIAYQASASEDEEVSVDGGHSWGRIGTLRFGIRLATPEDVTHVRWRVPANNAASGSGQIAYSGIVR